MMRELADAHHLADRCMHVGVRIPLSRYSKQRAVGGTVDKPPTRLNDTDVTCLISKKRLIIC